MLQPCQLNLWSAAEAGDEAGLLRALEQGASVRASNRMKWNALHRACMSHSPRVVTLVLEAAEREEGNQKKQGSSGVDWCPLISTEDSEGNSPLHVAAGIGHLSVVQRLLSARANVNARKKHGVTPLHCCCQALAESTSMSDSERMQEVVVALINAGGLLDAEDDSGSAAVMFLGLEQRQTLLKRIQEG